MWVKRLLSKSNAECRWYVGINRWSSVYESRRILCASLAWKERVCFQGCRSIVNVHEVSKASSSTFAFLQIDHHVAVAYSMYFQIEPFNLFSFNLGIIIETLFILKLNNKIWKVVPSEELSHWILNLCIEEINEKCMKHESHFSIIETCLNIVIIDCILAFASSRYGDILLQEISPREF